jgi:hypothetical protein
MKQGNRNSNEMETCDEDDSKIQIDAPQSSIPAVTALRGRCCNFHDWMRGRPYVTAYDGGYYYPTTYYGPGYPYSYYDYGPTYERTIVRSGTRYNDAYGPRYYGSTVYDDGY